MPTQRSAQEWVRLSMRTPGILIFGMVMAPCGWILNLTSTVSPNWRTLNSIPNQPSSVFIQQGIFDVCQASTTSSNNDCTLVDTPYFGNQIIPVAQGLMVASLIVTLIGLAVAIPGVRCWKENPQWVVAGLGGLLIFCSGVLTIIPIAWYTHNITNFATVTSQTEVRVGYCIVLGYIGGIFEVLGGLVMFIGICRCCGGKNRGEIPIEEAAKRYGQPRPQSRPQPRPQPQPRRMDLDRPRSTASSIPYSMYSADDDVSFPRAKSPAPQSGNTSFNGKPYDVDL